MKIDGIEPLTVVKRAVYLAWKACGGTVGLGYLQDRGNNMTEEQIWDQAYSGKDYPGGRNQQENRVHCDYVFGRMMELMMTWDAENVYFRDGKPTPDYQAWCEKYPTYENLIQAAIDSLK